TEKHMDKIEVKVEVANEKLLTSYAALEQLQEKIKHNIFTVLNMHIKVTLVEPQSLKRFEGKAKRVTDLRTKD
ncbi:MAG: phenylacetate--CoA ligase, partial [Christensenellaceae bacterium]